MGYTESAPGCAIIAILRAFVIPRNLGIITGADGMMRLFPGLVREPDVAYRLVGSHPGSDATRPSPSPDSRPTWPSRS